MSAAGASTPTERDRFRAVISHFASGVAVVTASTPVGIGGMTANAVASVSLDPLLMLVCFDNTARTLALVRESGRFGVNVLRAGQRERARAFASKLDAEAMFDGVELRADQRVPIFADALAWLVCDLHELLPGGDHTIALGAVRQMGHDDGEPLLWYRGGFVPYGA